MESYYTASMYFRRTYMMKLWMVSWLFVWWIAATSARAGILPTMSLRYLMIEADVIIVGDPVGSEAGVIPSSYKVTQVIKGEQSMLSREVFVRDEDIYSLSPGLWSKGGNDHNPPPRITKAMLFLKNATKENDRDGYGTVLSGIRAVSENGDLLVPQQLKNPGPQHLIPMKDHEWDAMFAQIREDLPAIARVLEMERITDPAKRNQAVLKWIESHKHDFSGGYFENGKIGWAALQPRLFKWVMESCIPEDCWRAHELAADIDSFPGRSTPSFCSPEGRELLMSKVFDKNIPESLRLIALGELGDGGVFWYGHRQEFPATRVVTQDEQKAVIDRILPLLESKDALWRASAVRCLMAVSWPYDANFSQMTSKQAVPKLVESYQRERIAEVRDPIAESIRRLEDEFFWQDLTGNPHGIVVFVRFVGIKNGAFEFQVNLDYSKAKITEAPVFLLERLDADGKVLQSRSVKADVTYPADLFTRGWEDDDGMVIMTVAAPNVESGSWRVTAKGRVGKDTWRSEPIELSVPQSQ